MLFKYEWVRSKAEKKDGITLVNMEHIGYSNDPFVIASQVHQVFYVRHPNHKGWHFVIQIRPRDTYDIKDNVVDAYTDGHLDNTSTDAHMEDSLENDDNVNVIRNDMDGVTFTKEIWQQHLNAINMDTILDIETEEDNLNECELLF
jgi:hypothetical protein